MDKLRMIMVQCIHDEIATLEIRYPNYPREKIQQSRESLSEWAEALEQETTIAEIRRRQLRAQGKPILRVVN